MFGLDIIEKLEQANEDLAKQLSDVHTELVTMNSNLEQLIKLQTEALELRRKQNDDE